ncbi:MAG: nucleotide pyrophosphohydrolase [Lachnospiraceae bacterium]|nr:nucleotide pyrophosphohydrolase [Lachnospiraceae bacterium]
MEVSIRDYEEYLYDHYKEHGIDASLFMKLVEEVGEVAEVLNKRDGRKASDNEDLKCQLANELVDVVHYAFAIASLNQIDLNEAILDKDRIASIKYKHELNLEQFLLRR